MEWEGGTVMSVKARSVKAAAIYASCGHCGEELVDADDSFMLDIASTGPTYECPGCGTTNTLPKTARIV